MSQFEPTPLESDDLEPLPPEAAIGLAYGVPLMPLPASLKSRLMARLELPELVDEFPIETSLKQYLDYPIAELIAIAQAQKKWTPLPSPEDAMRSTLKTDAANRQVAFFIRAPKAGALPRHHHATGEVVLVLEGDFESNGVVYQVGDRLVSPGNSQHKPTTQGCLVLCISSIDDERLEDSLEA